ncbi:MAG TPA: hypothetical protein VKY57_08810 [Chitinispirillaceae bacterium]|nr:hypothetical protein [Chitinispirillaceae bacterium]
MGLKKYIFKSVLVSAVLVFGVLPVFSASGNSSMIDSALVLLVKQDYAGAKNLLELHRQKYPLDNDALYLEFAVEQTKILDYESYIIENDAFQLYAENVKTEFDKRLETLSGHDSLMCVFYAANVSGGISIMQAKVGKWIDAVKNAVQSVSVLRDVCKADPDFYAAYLGVGVFDYYLSTSFRWVPFVSRRTKEGIKNINIALNADFPYNYAAMNSLCWILIEQKQFKSADSLAHSVLKIFPDNTMFLRIRALISMWTGQYKQAIRFAEKLIDLSKKRDPLNWSDLVAGYTIITCSYDKLGLPDKACKSAQDFEQFDIPKPYLEIPHIKKNIKEMTGVLSKYKS